MCHPEFEVYRFLKGISFDVDRCMEVRQGLELLNEIRPGDTGPTSTKQAEEDEPQHKHRRCCGPANPADAPRVRSGYDGRSVLHIRFQLCTKRGIEVVGRNCTLSLFDGVQYTGQLFRTVIERRISLDGLFNLSATLRAEFPAGEKEQVVFVHFSSIHFPRPLLA